MTWHMTKYVTKVSFADSRWASLWAWDNSDQLTFDQLTYLEALPFYTSNYSKLNESDSSFGKAQPIRQTEQMASRSGSCRATPAVGRDSRSCKTAASRLDNKCDELGAPEKSTPALSHANAPEHASTPAPRKPILAPNYSEADVIKSWRSSRRPKIKNQKLRSPASNP